MPTETTKDAVIVFPEGQTPPTITETGSGTTATFTTPTAGAEVEVSGNLVVAGGPVTQSTFTFTESGKVDFTNVIKESKVKGTTGQDSVTFSDGKVKNTTVKLGEDSDSVVFGTKSKGAKVNMGNDNAADVVNIEDRKDVKKMTIKNFGSNDTLIVGGREFGFDDLQDRDFKNITIKFD